MDVSLITAISAAAGAVLSGVATTIAILVAYKVHQNQKLLSQRQLLLPLWDYMATLSKIDSNKPITPDVIKVVNTLELVAICCEGGMIDEKNNTENIQRSIHHALRRYKKMSLNSSAFG